MARSPVQFSTGQSSDAPLCLLGEALRRDRFAWMHQAQDFDLRVVIRPAADEIEEIYPETPTEEAR